MPRREDSRRSDDTRKTTRRTAAEPISAVGVEDNTLQFQQFMANSGAANGSNGSQRSLDLEFSQRLGELPDIIESGSQSEGYSYSSSSSNSGLQPEANSAGGGGNKFKPIIEALKSSVIMGRSIKVTSMYKYFDLDNNALRKIRITDNGNAPSGGYFMYKGERLIAHKTHEFLARDLQYLRYRSGAQITQEVFTLQAFDGGFWSSQDQAVVSTKRDTNEKPKVTLNDFRGVSDERYRVDQLLRAVDPDKDGIQKYRVRYSIANGGYLEYRGKKVKAGEWVQFDAKHLNKLFLVSESWGSGVRDINISAAANDGRDWGKTKTRNYKLDPNSKRPDLTSNDAEIAVGQKLKASNFFRWSDKNRNSLKTVEFYDTGVRAEGGYFTVDGVKQKARKWFSVKFEDIAKVDYIGASIADKERLRIRVSDGRHYSKIKTVLADTVAVPVIRMRDTIVLDELEEVKLSDIFFQEDAGPKVRLYRVYDSNTDNRSARMYDANGNRLKQGKVYTLTPDEFRSLTIKGGKSDGRAYDSIMVRANNGQRWSNWSRTNISTETNYISALRDGRTWNGSPGEATQLTYSFLLWIPSYYPLDAQERDNFVAYDAEQRVGARKSLQFWANVSGLSFREQKQNPGSDVGHIAHGTADLGDENIAAWAYYPRSLSPALPGDVWLNNTVASNFDQTENTWGFLTHLHEHGHAFGLKHSFDDRLDSQPVLPFSTESHQFTVMSYNTHPDTGFISPSTPMLYDIAAIQAIYGTNWNYNKNATTYKWDRNEQFVHTIWDGGGVDTLDFTNQVRRLTIDLRQGQFSSIGTLQNNLAIAFRTVIENAWGGQHSDQITGNEAKNVINGNAGNDRLTGMGGPDILRGGKGNDTYIYNIGDGNDRIDEQGGAGRDQIQIHVDRNMYSNFGDGSDPNKNDDALKDHLHFRRIAGQGLQISLTMNENAGRGGIKILGQGKGGSRVETLKLFADGKKVKRDIDLDAIYQQATNKWQAFELTNFEGRFGYIALPV